ncbi:MAG TPA: CoA transferase, partial [Bryobacteraceae bacterium]|nr:CoA transferase [Bryobacteraceae bacterium]
IGSEKLWATFCGVIGKPELAAYPDYATNALRIANRVALKALLEAAFATATGAEWLARLQSAGIPASLVRNFEEVASHPQCEVRRMFPTLDHPTAGKHRVTGTPVKLSETPGGPSSPAPLLGEHTRDALRKFFDLADSTLDDLAARGVIFEPIT